MSNQFKVEDRQAEVIFISPFDRRNHKYLPFGLLYLSSWLEKNNIKTEIIDYKEEQSCKIVTGIKHLLKSSHSNREEVFIDIVLRNIEVNNPYIVCFPCYTAEYAGIMKIAKLIKDISDTKIVVGGVHATLKPEDFLFANSPVDFLVIGDGETPLLKLYESIKNNSKLYASTQGIAYFENNNIVNNGCWIELDLSKFPMPMYDKINMNFYVKPNINHIRWAPLAGVQIFTGRGCPYNCEFCAVNFLKEMNPDAKKMRYRSIEQVIEELTYLKSKYKIDGFYIIDDCFMVSKERTVEFCKQLIACKLNLIWAAETRANLVIKDDNVLKLMKEAGLIQLDFGIETGSPKMLKEINKKITIEQARKALSICKQNGIRTYANMLFNIPNEMEEDVVLSHKFLRDSKPTVVGCGLTVPLLGTAFYEKHVSPKLTPEEYNLYNQNVYEEIVDSRFKLAKHNLDMTSIVTKLNNKYRAIRTIPLISFYWKKVLGSHYLGKYLYEYISLLLQPIDNLLSKMLSKVFKFIKTILQVKKKLALTPKGAKRLKQLRRDV